MNTNNQNILIAGIGGQGVNSLSVVIQKILLDKGYFCKGAIYKGGAQKRGAIYSTIRIFNNAEQGLNHSATVPLQRLDTLLALESTESLRYGKYFNKGTNMLVNDFRFPFYSERFHNFQEELDVQKVLGERCQNFHYQNLTEQSKRLFGNESMINILIGLEAIKKEMLPINGFEFLDKFQQKTKINYENMLILMDEYEIG